MAFDVSVELNEAEEIEELDGNLSSQTEDQKLMHSVLENDKQVVDDGKLVESSLNQGMSAFTPDMMFAQLVKNYSIAKQLYGETLLRLASGYNPDYIKKNIGIPEFRNELKQRLISKHQQLEHQGLVGKDGAFTESGITLASLVLYTEELDHLAAQGFLGEKPHKRQMRHGDASAVVDFKKGHRYRDMALRKSIKRSIRRSHVTLDPKDLYAFEREGKGKSHIIYALDSSGSMRGKKIEACKKAGIALAYKALSEKDKVGLLIFGGDVRDAIEPTDDFFMLLRSITKTQASKETDIAATIRKAVEIFPEGDGTKHLLLITDAMPTKGENPERDAIEAASIARNCGITISVIGIDLDEKGAEFAKKVTTVGDGKLSIVSQTDNLDVLVLEDYYGL